MVKITVVIATYNAGKTLKQALDSIRYQTYKNIELIVIDGLSSDNTLEIIKEYKDIVTKYVSEKDTGIYNAFNKGIMMATGDYISFLGADDCFSDYEVIEDIVYELDSSVFILSAPIKEVNIDTLREKVRSNRLTNEEVFCGSMIPHPGLFVKLDIMKKYMFNENNKIVSDYEFLVRYLSDGGTIKFIDRAVVFFATGGISGGNKGSLNAQRSKYEQMRILDVVGLDKKYLDAIIYSDFKIMNSWRFHLKWFFISFFSKIYITQCIYRLRNLIVRIIGSKRHDCNLKYCRWCGKSNR